MKIVRCAGKVYHVEIPKHSTCSIKQYLEGFMFKRLGPGDLVELADEEAAHYVWARRKSWKT